MTGHASTSYSFEPLFLEGSAPVAQVMRIAAISPWAFIGYENISHLSEEFSFPVVRARRVLVASILTSTGLYVFLSLLSVSANPEGYATWLDYIADISNLTGFNALPAFYGAGHYLGALGTNLLSVALFALIVTSLIGNTLALSRLFFALSRDRVIAARASVLSGRHIPSFTFLLVAVPSLVVPIFGRVAIGWILDVTTIGATVVYGFVSAAAMRLARELDIPRLNMHLLPGTYSTINGVKTYLYAHCPNIYLGYVRAFRNLAEKELQGSGTVFCIDNTSGFQPFHKQAIELLLESPRFGLTFDIGHSFRAGGADERFILEHRDRLCHFHIHDCSLKANHLALGEGGLDTLRYLKMADEKDCTAVIEVKESSALLHSKNYLINHGVW